MKYILTLTFVYLSIKVSWSNENVIIKYKKHQTIDLGNLEIKGKLIGPGDLSYQVKNRVKFEREVYERQDYLKEKRREIFYLK